MNRKIPFQELAARLAASAGVPEAESEVFIKHFFDTIRDGLLTDGSVTVKGFGTFSLDKSAPDPVIFTPDEAVRTIINAPFAQFEPEILNDEVTESMLNEAEMQFQKESESDGEPVSSAASEDFSEPVVAEEILTDDEDEEPVFIPLDSPSVSVTADTDDTEHAEQVSVNDTDAVTDTVTESTPEPTCESSHESDSSSGQVPEVITIEEEEEEHVSPDTSPSPTPYDDSGDDSEQEEQSRSGFGLGFLVGILVGLAIGAAATFFYTNLITNNPGATNDPEEELVEDDDSSISEDVQEVMTLPTDTIIPDTISSAQPEASAAAESEIPSSLPEAKPAAVTVKVKPGDHISGLALKHYGNRAFWVYIYQENKSKIKNPDNLTVGLNLIIPPAEKYGINSKSEASVKKAKALENEIKSKR